MIDDKLNKKEDETKKLQRLIILAKTEVLEWRAFEKTLIDKLDRLKI